MDIRAIVVIVFPLYLIIDGIYRLYKLNNKKVNLDTYYKRNRIMTIKDKEQFYKLEAKSNILVGFVYLQLYISALLQNDVLLFLTVVIILIGAVVILTKYIKIMEFKKDKFAYLMYFVIGALFLGFIMIVINE